jgi:adenylate cyclase
MTKINNISQMASLRTSSCALDAQSRFSYALRNSSFTYKGRTVDVKQVGRELGVRYVLGGSVRRSVRRLRIGAELSEASTGLQVWAERYDADLADFFGLQDQIAESVIAAIEPQLHAAEHRRFQSRSPDSLDAWGFVMKAMPHIWDWGSAEEIEVAQALLKRAIEIDPDYPRANSLFAWTQAALAQLGSADARNALGTAQWRSKRSSETPMTLGPILPPATCIWSRGTSIRRSMN